MQLSHEVHDLRPRRDVERGHRLVGDDERGICADRTRDNGALALAARHFVRIAARKGPGQAGEGENLARPLAGRRARKALNAQMLDNRVAESHARVERAGRILEHDLPLPTQADKLGASGASDRLALEAHFAPARVLQADEGSPEGALSAAALPDEAKRRAAADRKINAIDGAQKPFPRKLVMQGETDRFDDGLTHEALQQAA